VHAGFDDLPGAALIDACKQMIDGEPVGENENQTAIRLPGLDREWATPARRSPAGAILR
jgi:hypothetical protein